MSSFTTALATSSGGRYANAAVLLILGAFVLFMYVAVGTRVSPPRENHVDLDEDATADSNDPQERLAAQWLQGERRRRLLATRLRPWLLRVAVALLVASALAAVISWS